MGTSAPWPNTQALYRVIALGRAGLIADILYPLGIPRTDGGPSARTDQVEARMQSLLWWVTHSVAFEALRLHPFSTYMAGDGFRDPITQAVAQEYRALAQACSGTLSGTVYDLGTLKPIPGATVTARMNDVARGGAASTAADGGFRTGRLFPVLHDLEVTAPGYDTARLAQRLVPFNTDAPVQRGPIYLGRPCPAGQGCSMQGTYSVHYVLSGVEAGLPTSCTFDARMSLVQTDTTFQGTATTSAYQHGCDMPDGSYVYWSAGTTPVYGTIHGSTVKMVHYAIPTWYPVGRSYQTGFQVTEPAWHAGPFDLRVEIAGTKTSSLSAEQAAALRDALRNLPSGAAAEGGPRVRTNR